MGALVLLAMLAAGPLQGAEQLIVVRAPAWTARTGTLQRYAWRDRWVRVGAPVPVALGAGGLGWGRGVAPVAPADPPAPGPPKVEGDGKTPAGVFRLGAATGRAERLPSGGKLSYRQASERLVCVDDVHSPSYNQVVDAPEPGPDFKSYERMDAAVVYDWTLFVEHNPAREPGGGSCIFLHVWHVSRAPEPTAGCTAMAPAEMERLLAWLDPAARPLLVVLPDDAYRALRAGWALP